MDATQVARIRVLIVGRMPNRLKLSFYLWTRAAVAALIAREYPAIVWAAKCEKAVDFRSDLRARPGSDRHATTVAGCGKSFCQRELPLFLQLETFV